MKITYNDKHCILQITDASLDDRGYLELEFNDDLELVWANDNSFYSDNDSCDVLCKMGIMPARDFYATGYPETLLDWFKDLKERSDDLKNDFINEIWNAIIGIDPIYTSQERNRIVNDLDNSIDVDNFIEVIYEKLDKMRNLS